MSFDTPTALAILTIGGAIFGVYRYFRDPQVEGDKREALLSQQVKWAQEVSDKRFKDMQETISLLTAQNQNHIHTLDTKIETVSATMLTMSKEIVRLGTIIEERIPKK